VRQWRLHEPDIAVLLTGHKREIELLGRVPVHRASQVLVCDLSLLRNLPALKRLLAARVSVRYVDHHSAGPIPDHPLLEAVIDTAADTCTSLLMDRLLSGRFRDWALVGAYGDNLTARADAIAMASGFDASQRATLRRLGEAINYNAYGESPADGCTDPRDIYRHLSAFRDPLSMAAHDPLFDRIDAMRSEDLHRCAGLEPVLEGSRARAWLLPNEDWARRAIGSFSNERAQQDPARAQAVMIARPSGDYRVSVRAPIACAQGAAGLCAAFGGRGRAAAAGIDRLPAASLHRFLAAIETYDWCVSASTGMR
jgi:hypothetical protein